MPKDIDLCLVLGGVGNRQMPCRAVDTGASGCSGWGSSSDVVISYWEIIRLRHLLSPMRDGVPN
jgi:hypothetical protein